MTLDEQLRENQKRIVALTQDMSLWMGTPNAQKKEVRAKIINIQDRTLFRLRELEVKGQHAKIASMSEVINLLKEGVT